MSKVEEMLVPLCLAVELQMGLCASCNKGSMVGVGTLLKEDRGEIMWTLLLKVHVTLFWKLQLFQAQLCGKQEIPLDSLISLPTTFFGLCGTCEVYLTGWEAHTNCSSTVQLALALLPSLPHQLCLFLNPPNFPAVISVVVCFLWKSIFSKK